MSLRPTRPLARFLLPLGVVTMVPLGAGAYAALDNDSLKALETLLAVYDRVRTDYVERVDDKTLVRGAIDGMLASLDPHSSYIDASDFQTLRMQTDGNYGGLGLQVQMEDGAVKVIAPMEDTPAWRAGVKPGDYITHLDGKLIYGGTLDEAVEQMRGKPGTSIRLTLVRPGRDKPFDVTVMREVIELKPVKWEVRGNVGYININSFSKDTGAGVRSAIVSIDKALGRSPAGYVVDLRSNPGGLLDEAVAVSDAFLEGGEVVSQRGRDPRDIERFMAKPGDDAKGLPVVVLVDNGSASASEIVAGALQDHHRGLVMGEQTFGKGSVQTLLPLTQQSALKLTTARYYTPRGRSVQEGGIAPDIVVPQLSDPDYKTRPRLREADLRKHLVSEAKVEDDVLESDDGADPRFSMTAEQLKAKGVKDFQLDYALRAVERLAAAAKPAPTK